MNISKPGDRILGEVQARDWTQQILAEVMDRPAQMVSEIINGKKEITRETAAQLGAALNTPAELWLQMQDAYFLQRLRQDPRVQEKLAGIASRARSVVIEPPPAQPRYKVVWSSEERKYVATVDFYPHLRATAKSETYVLRKLKSLVSAAQRAEETGEEPAGGKGFATRRL
jgi:addiction module HigA family antidote